MNEKRLALFDFDGTITKKDSLIKFIRFSTGNIKFSLGVLLLSPMLIAYTLKLIPNHKAKEYMISYFFKGMKQDVFLNLAKNYSLTQIKHIVRPEAIRRLTWHQQQGHNIVIVSASIECWLKPWCMQHGIELIATKLEFKNNVFTGKFLTKNCYGVEKVNRIQKLYNLNDYSYIYAYGDSKGDAQLLSLSDESYYKPFRVQQ